MLNNQAIFFCLNHQKHFKYNTRLGILNQCFHKGGGLNVEQAAARDLILYVLTLVLLADTHWIQTGALTKTHVVPCYM